MSIGIRPIIVGAMAALGAAASGINAQIVKPNLKMDQGQRAELDRMVRSLGYVGRHGSFKYRSGPGWTVAQVKHMAKKRRNQIKHKRLARKA